MSRSATDYLRHIAAEAQYLIRESKGLTKEEFFHNETLKRAFARSIEIIGEAARQVPHDVKARHGNIEWRAMAGMRDRLIHAYFGVDYDIVWDVVVSKVPTLRAEIEQLIHELDTEDRNGPSAT